MIQTEKGEWTLLPSGELVKTAAKESHKTMDEYEVTDVLPESYIFSDDKEMKFNKKDFEEVVVQREIPEYRENKTPKKYSEKSFADLYFYKKKQTPAETIAKIQRKHKVITDEDSKHNPFIQKANQLNKENRAPAIELVIQQSEIKKAELDANDQVEAMLEAEDDFQPTLYRKGGYTPKFKMPPPKYQYGDFSDYASGIGGGLASGAAAGAAIGSIIPGPGTVIGAGIGALVGGVGTYFTSRKNRRERDKALAELRNMQSKQLDLLNKSRTTGHLTTAAKFLRPVPKGELADYSGEVSRYQNATGRIKRGYNTSTQNQLAAANAANNSYVREAARAGATPAQIANMSARLQGQSAASTNDFLASRAGALDNVRLQEANYVNTLSKAQQDYNNAILDKYKQDLYNRDVAGINEFGNNEQQFLSQKYNMVGENYRDKQALLSAKAKEGSDRLAKVNNTISELGQAGTSIASSLYDTELLKALEGRKADGLPLPNINLPPKGVHSIGQDRISQINSYFDNKGLSLSDLRSGNIQIVNGRMFIAVGNKFVEIDPKSLDPR